MDIVDALRVGYPLPNMLLMLINGLPEGSRYFASVLGDDGFLGRTSETRVLADLFDLVQAFARSVCGGKEKPVPYPRPKRRAGRGGVSLEEFAAFAQG